MITTRLNAMAATALVISLLPAAAHAGVIYKAGPDEGPVSQEYELSQGWNTTALRQNYYYSRSDAFGLHSMLGLQGRILDNFFTSIAVDDVIVRSKTGSTRELITFGGDLTGEFLGVGNGTTIVTLFIGGYGEGTASTGISADTNGPSNVDGHVEISASVPVGVPFRVAALMELRGSALVGNRLVLDFADSFLFNSAAVFGVGSGVTVNSESWGLVNNSLVAAVPEPEIYTMMGLGLGMLGWMARRRKSEAA